MKKFALFLAAVAFFVGCAKDAPKAEKMMMDKSSCGTMMCKDSAKCDDCMSKIKDTKPAKSCGCNPGMMHGYHHHGEMMHGHDMIHNHEDMMHKHHDHMKTMKK